jgi:hypothetical protein
MLAIFDILSKMPAVAGRCASEKFAPANFGARDWTRTSNACALAPETSVSTNSTTRAHLSLLGCEPNTAALHMSNSQTVSAQWAENRSIITNCNY